MNTKEFKLDGDRPITKKQYAYVANTAVDKNIFPTDLGFKENKLTKPEFIAYANKVMNMDVEDFIYDNPEERKDVFFYLYRLNSHLIEINTTLSTEQIVNDNDYYKLKIQYLEKKVQHLEKRLSNATLYYNQLGNSIETMLDLYLTIGKETRKGQDIIVR